MNVKKIVTHEGRFHADEVCAVTIIKHLFPDAPVVRTYSPTEEDLNDPEVAVVDIGRRYEVELLNFDHHQDPTLDASNLLVLDYFFKDKPEMAALLKRQFMGYISDVDTGKVVLGSLENHTISGFVKMANSFGEQNGWDCALSVMRSMFLVAYSNALSYLESEVLWKTKVIKNTHYGISDTYEKHIVGWVEFAKNEGIKYLVSPNPRGGYSITSTDSSTYNIPVSPKQTFRHNSGFIAAYPDKETALEHLKEFINN